MGEEHAAKNTVLDEAHQPTVTKSLTHGKSLWRFWQNAVIRMAWGGALYTPQRCRWDPDHPAQFTLGLNILFSFVSLYHNIHHRHGEIGQPDDPSIHIATLPTSQP